VTRHFGTKGRGLAAAEDIPKDSLLLDEQGVFARPPSNKRLTSAVLSSTELSRELSVCGVHRCPDKVSFLTGHTYSEWSEAWRKVQANKFAVSVAGHPEAGGDMIFLRASLLNHSCGANSQVDFPYPGRIQVRSTAAIPQGQEITIDYWPGQVKPADVFRCACDCCTAKDRIEVPGAS